MFAISSARAQEGDIFESGFKPYGSFEGGDIDTVDLMIRAVHVRIPIISYPQRGGILEMKLAHSYSSRFFTGVDIGGAHCTQACYTYDFSRAGIISLPVDLSLSIQRQYVYPYSVWAITPEGSRAKIGSSNSSLDGAAYRVSPPPAQTCPLSQWITDRRGVRRTFGCTGTSAQQFGYYEDPNGNKITENYDANGGLSGYTDTMNRVINQYWYLNPTSDFSGCTGPLPTDHAYVWSIPGLAGGQQTHKLCQAKITVNVPCTGRCQTAHASYDATQTVVLPNGTTWIFQYDSADPNNANSVGYGDLLKITFPTGGSLSYTWHSASPTFACSLGSLPTFIRAVTSRTLDANDGKGPQTWTYSKGSGGTGYFSTVVQNPLGDQTVHTFTILSNTGFINGQTCSAYETMSQEYKGPSSGTPLRTIKTDYSTAEVLPPSNSEEYPAALPSRITTTLDSGQQKKVEMDYNYPLHGNSSDLLSDGNVTTQREYDYGSGSPLLLRTTSKTYKDSTNSAYLNANLVNPLSSVKVMNAGGVQLSYSSFNYDEYALASSMVSIQHDLNPPNGATRGNQTSISRWLDTTGGYLTNTSTYFDTGTLNTATDPLLNRTTYLYSNTFAGAYRTSATNALNQNTTYGYDFNTGLVTSVTDPNSQITSKQYDIMGRLTQVGYPDGGSMSYCYTDMGGSTCTKSGPPYAVVTTQPISSLQAKISTSAFDGLGRLFQNQLNSDPSGTDYVDTTYDGLGREATVRNPHRTAPSPTDGITIYSYDALGRLTSETEPDSSQILTSYASYPCTTVTDEAGNPRQTCVDGLGRTTKVVEYAGVGGTYETDYLYDALDNLTRVQQIGGDSNQANWRIRQFNYDSLSRLKKAVNPESGTIVYGYDDNGNIITRTSPQPNAGSSTVTATYSYDVLDRPVKTAYSDGRTPLAQYGYDGIAPPSCTPPTFVWSPNVGQLPTYQIGRRTSMCDGSGATSWGYDSMGRLEIEQRVINGVNKNTVYEYTLGGQLAHTFYPSGNRVDFATDGAGRNYGVTDPADNYVFPNALFAPNGALIQANYSPNTPAPFGGVQIYNFYNKRQQLVASYATWQKVLYGPGNFISKHCYDYHVNGGGTFGDDNFTCTFLNASSGDNGNIYRITNGIDDNRTQNYSYDSLNRIFQAYTNGPNWGETFTIDAWGNLTNKGPVTGKTNYENFNSPALANNQLTGYNYDAAGNVLQDSRNNALTYDAENRIAQVGSNLNYTYDGDGRRVEKSAGTIYWPGAGGETLAESDLSGNINEEYIYFNGGRVARVDRPSGLIHYYVSDPLGSSRIVADTTGVIGESDYYPYGTEIPIIGNVGKYKFTGKERDAESVLDYFESRHYASTMGRFMQSDRLFATPLDVVNPQGWNMYAYVLNNPANYIDPDGKDAIAVNFANGVPLGGHEGIIVVHADGSATYARFGPEHTAYPADKGRITIKALNSVKFGSNGLPTDASYKELSEEVANIEGEPASTVGFNYFKTSEADSVALDNWMQEWKTHQAPDYNVSNQNCATFCIAGLLRGHAIENKGNSYIPNLLFMQLASRATENWTWQGRKTNPEPGVDRHKQINCLKTRDGFCIK